MVIHVLTNLYARSKSRMYASWAVGRTVSSLHVTGLKVKTQIYVLTQFVRLVFFLNGLHVLLTCDKNIVSAYTTLTLSKHLIFIKILLFFIGRICAFVFGILLLIFVLSISISGCLRFIVFCPGTLIQRV